MLVRYFVVDVVIKPFFLLAYCDLSALVWLVREFRRLAPEGNCGVSCVHFAVLSDDNWLAERVFCLFAGLEAPSALCAHSSFLFKNRLSQSVSQSVKSVTRWGSAPLRLYKWGTLAIPSTICQCNFYDKNARIPALYTLHLFAHYPCILHTRSHCPRCSLSLAIARSTLLQGLYSPSLPAPVTLVTPKPHFSS